MKKNKAIDKAAEIIGNKAKLARTLHVSPTAVTQWSKGLRSVPPIRAVEIEKATNGKVKRKDLCPNFPWDDEAAQVAA